MLPKRKRLRRAQPSADVKLSCKVVLLADKDDDDEKPKWVQVAVAREYRGYNGGYQPFVFTREHFDQMVRNIRSHPSFVAGEDGIGTSPVIPWDFNHASEQDPTSGNLPVVGAPASGWTYDLQVRSGADGFDELWALTKFQEPALGYVKSGAYQWASVAVTFDAVDPVTAQPVGAMITSIALTNTPFIEGMQRLAASRASVRARHYFYEAASEPEMAVDCLREMFALPATSGVDMVIGEIAKLAEWTAAGAEPPVGVDMDGMIGGIRKILALPALMPEAEVLTNAMAMINQYVASETDDEPGAPAPQPATAAASKGWNMDLLKILASKLGVRELAETVAAEVEALIGLRDELVKLTASDSTAAKVLLKKVADAGAAREKLMALLQALGVEDAEGGVEKVAGLMESASKLEEVMPELAGLRSKVEKQEEAAVETDVAAVMSSRKFTDEGMRVALTTLRKSDPAAFAKHYEADLKRAPVAPHLTRDVVTTGTGAPIRAGGTTTRQPADPMGGAQSINLMDYPGANPTARAMSYLSLNREGFNKLTHDEQFQLAVAFKKQPHVRCEATH